MNKSLNAKVEEATYVFNQHYGRGYISISLSVAGGGFCKFNIAPNSNAVVESFLRNVFGIVGDDEFDIRKLKGLPLIAVFEKNGNGEIVAVSNFMDEQMSVKV